MLAAVLVPAAAVPSLRQSFDVLADLPAGSDSKVGFDLVAAHFDKGSLLPITTVVTSADGTDLTTPASLAALHMTTDRLLATPGVEGVRSLITPSGDGTTPDAFRPSRQLAGMATQFTPAGDPATALERLLQPRTAEGLRSTGEYVGLVGKAYPTVEATPTFRAATTDLAAMQTDIETVRTTARVSTQLDRILVALAAGSAGPDALRSLSGYIAEVGNAYPDVSAAPAFSDLQTALTAAASGVPVDRARLGADLTALRALFADRPDAYLLPTSLPATPEASAMQAELAGISARLPAELSSLSATLAARPDDYFVPAGLSGSGAASVQQSLAAYVSPTHDVTRIYAVLAQDPYSPAAFDTVARVRAAIAPAAGAFGNGVRVLVGGATAQELDLQSTINSDFLRVAAITVLGVLIVLVLLLRSLVAPLYLVGTVLLSYLGTLGLTSWFFQDVLGQSGLNYFLPLMVFVLLVALGSDYNIFLMSRVREESEARGTRQGIQCGIHPHGRRHHVGRVDPRRHVPGDDRVAPDRALPGGRHRRRRCAGRHVPGPLAAGAGHHDVLGDRAWWPSGRVTHARPRTPPLPGPVAPRS